MLREIVYRKNATGETISLFQGANPMQRISIDDLNQYEKSETMFLALEWQRQAVPVKTAAHTAIRRKARLTEDLELSAKVARFATDLANKHLLQFLSRTNGKKNGRKN